MILSWELRIGLNQKSSPITRYLVCAGQTVNSGHLTVMDGNPSLQRQIVPPRNLLKRTNQRSRQSVVLQQRNCNAETKQHPLHEHLHHSAGNQPN